MKSRGWDFLSQLFPQAECLSYFPHSFLSLHRLTLFWQSCYHRIHSAVRAEMEGNLKEKCKNNKEDEEKNNVNYVKRSRMTVAGGGTEWK